MVKYGLGEYGGRRMKIELGLENLKSMSTYNREGELESCDRGFSSG